MTAPPHTLPLTRSSVIAALDDIKEHIHRTPVLTSSALNDIASSPQKAEALIGTPEEGRSPARPKINLFFKCENFQKIGAFKIRGASHALSRLSKEEVERGVVTHSSGNHAQALALAAKRFDTIAHIVMPTISTPSKIAATKGYGARVYFSGSTSDEREAVVKVVQAKTGSILIPPYDHPDIILGQGTIALELEQQVDKMVAEDPTLSVHYPKKTDAAKPLANEDNVDIPQTGRENPPKHVLDAVIAPLGGGGMLAGIATTFSPTPTRIYGAEPSFQGADDGRRGLAAGKRIPRVSTLTIADGLRTPVGEINWTVISDKSKVVGVYAVTEEQIKAAVKLVLERLKVWVEPSAAVGLAVVLFNEGFRRLVEQDGDEGWDIGVVLSGGNISAEGMAEILKTDEKRQAGQEKEAAMKAGREEDKLSLDGERVVLQEAIKSIT